MLLLGRMALTWQYVDLFVLYWIMGDGGAGGHMCEGWNQCLFRLPRHEVIKSKSKVLQLARGNPRHKTRRRSHLTIALW